jgi:hypothetical protein
MLREVLEQELRDPVELRQPLCKPDHPHARLQVLREQEPSGLAVRFHHETLQPQFHRVRQRLATGQVVRLARRLALVPHPPIQHGQRLCFQG